MGLFNKGVTTVVIKAVGMISELKDLLMVLRGRFPITVNRTFVRLPRMGFRTHVGCRYSFNTSRKLMWAGLFT